MAAGSSQIASNQAQTFLRIWAELSPYVRRDRALPARLERILKQNRQFGSRDRRLYRELTYTALRHLPWVESGLAHATNWQDSVRAVTWLAADLPATRGLKNALAGDWPAPTTRMSERAAHLKTVSPSLRSLDVPLLPEWFRAECPEAFHPPLYDLLQTRASLWVRLQTDDVPAVVKEFREQGWSWEVAPVNPSAWKLRGEADVIHTHAYRNGAVEIQDLGSQLVLAGVGVSPGERWLDACAGAGGKTLQLARLVGPGGQVVAHDVRTEALAELRSRAGRAGLNNVTIEASPQGEFDGVLVDVPCSGTGTWRRSPHLKWSTTPAVVAEMARVQAKLLDAFASNVRVGGKLVYATCSLGRSENEDIVRAFLQRSPNFGASAATHDFGFPHELAGVGLTVNPLVHDTDGFYVAALIRR